MVTKSKKVTKKKPRSAKRDLAAELRALGEAIRKTANLEVEWKAGKPATAKTVAAAKALGLTDDVLALWQAMDGCTCSWTDTSEDAVEDSQGGFEIGKLADVIREDREGRIYFQDDPEDDPKRRFYPFESHDPFGSGGSCGFVLGGKKLVVHYLSGEPELHTLGVDLAGFVDLLLANRGYLYWQGATVERDKARLGEIRADVKRIFGT